MAPTTPIPIDPKKNVLLSVPAQIPDGMLGSQLVFSSYVDPTHRRYYSFEKLNNLLKSSGFTNYQVTPLLRFTPILYNIYPWFIKYPLFVLSRILQRVTDPKLLTSVWFVVASKDKFEVT